MKEPKRLLSHGATDFERQLLRAVVSERPSALLRSRMQRGLGLVGPLAWASNVKAMFGTVTSRVAAGVAVVGVVVAGGFTAARLLPSSNEETAVAPAPLQASPVQAPLPTHEVRSAEFSAPAAAPQAAAPQAAAPQASAPPASPTVASPAPISPPASATEPTALDDDALPSDVVASPGATDDDGRLREEIALLDAARAALKHGNRSGARASLSVYRERFPNGVLRREANILRGRADAKGAE